MAVAVYQWSVTFQATGTWQVLGVWNVSCWLGLQSNYMAVGYLHAVSATTAFLGISHHDENYHSS